MAEADAVLSLRHLRVDIPTRAGILHAVRDVSFDVARGQTLCLVGESGCGKSLTSLSLMGLLPPHAVRTVDRLSFQGSDLRHMNAREFNGLRGNRMAMIFQEPMTALNPAYTIGDQLTEHYILHRKSTRNQARDRAIELLEKVGIASAGRRLGQHPHELSGGLRQRVMIAMALMCGPDLLIADEPTTALDVTIQAQILRLLGNLQKELGIAMILITHDLGVVAHIADRVAVMYAGEIVEEGPAAQVFREPHHPYTVGLLRCIPVPGRTRPGDHLGTIPGVVPSLVGEQSGCAFRDRCAWVRPECAGTIPVRTNDRGQTWRCIHETLEKPA